MAIRPATRADLPALRAVIDATGLFPSDMLPDMMAAYLAAAPDCADIWLVDDDGGPHAVAFVAPEQLTSGAWNLYLVAVHPEWQGRGRGAALLQYIEEKLAARGARILLVETSGLPEFERARAFYRKCGYEEEARIREFYNAGEDKIVFRKALRASA